MARTRKEDCWPSVPWAASVAPLSAMAAVIPNSLSSISKRSPFNKLKQIIPNFTRNHKRIFSDYRSVMSRFLVATISDPVFSTLWIMTWPI